MAHTGHVVEEIVGGGVQVAKHAAQRTQQSPENDSRRQTTADEVASSTTAPSSPPPADRILLSSDAPPSDSELSSLPSSPPQMPSPIVPSRKPAFSFLKRKRSATDADAISQPLASISANAQRCQQPMKKAMTQMQIDLGGEVRKLCRTCGMDYIPSVKEDAALHKEYCGMNVGGLEVGKSFLRDESIKKLRMTKLPSGRGETLVVVDQQSSIAARNRVKKLLDVVNTELGAADLNDEHLWGAADGNSGGQKTTGKRKSQPVTENRAQTFKIFLHVIGERCIGFCLAEKISHAFPVVGDKTKLEDGGEITPISKSSSIMYSTSAEVVLLGVSRIWTSRSHRGQGVAPNLLDCARSNFFYGVEVPRHLVAFSQPTESGGKLAERWFNSETGWHVYLEGQS